MHGFRGHKCSRTTVLSPCKVFFLKLLTLNLTLHSNWLELYYFSWLRESSITSSFSWRRHSIKRSIVGHLRKAFKWKSTVTWKSGRESSWTPGNWLLTFERLPDNFLTISEDSRKSLANTPKSSLIYMYKIIWSWLNSHSWFHKNAVHWLSTITYYILPTIMTV